MVLFMFHYKKRSHSEFFRSLFCNIPSDIKVFRFIKAKSNSERVSTLFINSRDYFHYSHQFPRLLWNLKLISHVCLKMHILEIDFALLTSQCSQRDFLFHYSKCLNSKFNQFIFSSCYLPRLTRHRPCVQIHPKLQTTRPENVISLWRENISIRMPILLNQFYKLGSPSGRPNEY